MKRNKHYLRNISLGITLLFGTFNVVMGDTFTTADGHGADAQVSENDDLSSGDGGTTSINTRYNNSNRNELIYLRFDISSLNTNAVNNAVLKMTSFRDSTSYTIMVYGLNDGHIGENWDESTISYNNAPGAKLKTGEHIILPEENTPLANYWLTLCQQSGLEMDRFSHSTGSLNELIHS